MDDEEAFQDAIAADPTNGLTRRVFADWLEERGDPRALGYRALGVQGLTSCAVHTDKTGVKKYSPNEDNGSWLRNSSYKWCQDETFLLTDDWFDVAFNLRGANRGSSPYGTMRTLDDEAALAFTKLPPARQLELLTEPVAAPVPA